MNTQRMSETATLLTLFIAVEKFNQPYGVVYVFAFGMLSMLLIVWRAK